MNTLPEILETFRKMKDIPVLLKTADILEEMCGNNNLSPHKPLDVLTLLYYHAQAATVIHPTNPTHDTIASQQSFVTLVEELYQTVTGEDTSGRAKVLAWSPFVELAIGSLRGPGFGPARLIQVDFNGERKPVEIDDIAVRIVEEMKQRMLERESSTAVNQLTALGTQLKSPRDVSFVTVQEWNKFLNRSISDAAQEALNTELFRTVTNAMTLPVDPNLIPIEEFEKRPIEELVAA